MVPHERIIKSSEKIKLKEVHFIKGCGNVQSFVNGLIESTCPSRTGSVGKQPDVMNNKAPFFNQ